VRHRRAGRKLGRNTNERQSLFRNLINALILNGQIKTTVAKAKTIRPLVDKLLTLAKQGTLASRRHALATLTNKLAVTKLFKDWVPAVGKRVSGFTRIQRVGRRLGDNTLMAKIEFVDRPVAKKPEATKK